MSDKLYSAKLFPLSGTNPNQQFGDPKRSNFGICFSGGGSRALSCSWGYMIGLTATDVMSKARYLSSVSGGSWASSTYSYLPNSISDADYLGSYHAPATLSLSGGAGKFDLSKLGEKNLGNVPGNLTFEKMGISIIEFLLTSALYLYSENNLSSEKLKETLQWLWMYIVGNGVLTPYGLYNYDILENISFRPTQKPPFKINPPWNAKNSRSFTLSESYGEKHISGFNPDQFVTERSGSGDSPDRPILIINTVLLENTQTSEGEVVMQVPIQVSPVSGAIFGRNPITQSAGGGGVDPFGFTSLLQGAQGDTASVKLPRRFNLTDITSLSSAFFAETLASMVHDSLQFFVDATDAELKELLPGHSPIIKEIENDILKEVLNELATFAREKVIFDDLIPKYNYWSVSDAESGNIKNKVFEFSDGGTFENSGILGLLSQTDVDRAIAFMSTEEPLNPATSSDPNTIVAADMLSSMFGVAFDGFTKKFAPYEPGGINPFTKKIDSLGFLTIFDDGVNQFQKLREGLIQSTYDSTHGYSYYPAYFSDTYKLIKNPDAGIFEEREIKVLWVQNARINMWQNLLNDPELIALLQQGQEGQNPDGTPNGKKGSGDLNNFPYYNTFTQIGLSPVATNTLSQMWAWATQDPDSPLTDAIKQFLA